MHRKLFSLKSHWMHSDELDQSADAKESGSRFHLHNHALDHKSKKSGLKKIATFAAGVENITQMPTLGRSNSHDQLRRSSCSQISSLTNSTATTSSLATLQDNFAVRGHEFTRASCSRYFGDCESCHKTVHSHRYFYCRNCPVVLHQSTHCRENLTRDCPQLELGVKGWGEGQCLFSEDAGLQVPLTDVFLGVSQTDGTSCPDCGVPFVKVGSRLETKRSVDSQDSGKGLRRRITNQGSRLQFFSSMQNFDDVQVQPPTEDDQQVNNGPRSPNGLKFGREVRACHLTSRNYCQACHWMDRWYIPGSLFLLNDMDKYPVSRRAYLKLRVLWDIALVALPDDWLRENKKAEDVFRMRRQLAQMRAYTSSCLTACDVKNRHLKDQQLEIHMINEPLRMRMCEVIEALEGKLLPRLAILHQGLKSHVESCQDCLARSTNCFICQAAPDESLALFGDDIVTCQSCHRIAHLSCCTSSGLLEGIFQVLPKCPQCGVKRAESSYLRFHIE